MLLRELDIFRRISTDHHTGSSKGGLLSLLGLLLALYLSFGVLSNFVAERYRVTLDVRESDNPALTAILNFTLPNKPCGAVQLHWIDML
jgi:hypothetical protein